MGFNLSKEIGSVSDSVVKISVMLFVIWVLVILFGNLSGNSGFSEGSLGANQSDDILNNATGGMLKLVNFSGNWFTILGIGLLIVILIGLLVKAVGGFGSVTGAGRGGRFGSE